jgi:hypothetical protein
VKAVIAYALAIGGVAMLAFLVVKTIGGLQYRDARTTLVNLLRTNPNHAELICRNATGTFMEAIGAALKTAAMAQTRDPNVIPKTSRPAYDAAATGVTMGWKQVLGKAKLAVMAAGGGLAIGISTNKASIWLYLLAGAAAIGIVWLFVHTKEIDRTLVLARAEILPEVDRAFVEGRYQLPPAPR